MKTFLRRLVAQQLERRVQELIRKNHLKVVAITGSVGKTTTKLATATVLRQKYRVLAHPGNYNSEIGLPLSIFELDAPANLLNPIDWFRLFSAIDQKLTKPYPYDVLVLEMGADQPRDIQKFMRYIRPDIGIVTAIAPAHIEQFGSIEAIAEEKMALARGSEAVFLNAEDTRVMTEAKKLGMPVQTYGVHKGNVHFENVERLANLCLKAHLQLIEGELTAETQLIGRHSLSALAAAAAVGEELGLTTAEIKAGLEGFIPTAGRMQVLEGMNGAMLIDDTYNSSPRATMAALQEFMQLPGRKIVILGNMNELGEDSQKEHRKVGHEAAKVDVLVTIGDLAQKYLAAGAIESGLNPAAAHSYDSPYKAGEFVKSIIQKGDVVLAKGSQNKVFAEEAVALILANPRDRKKLVRQSKSWERKKRQQFRY